MKRQAINSLVKRGRIPVDADGLIDLDVARSVIAGLSPAKSKAAANLAGAHLGRGASAAEGLAGQPAAADQGAAANGAASPEADAEDGDRIVSYHVARTLREAYGAKLERLAYLEKTGELVKAADVRRAAFEAARQARDALMSLPARLAAVLAAETSAARVHELLALEIRRVCDEIATGDAGRAPN